MKTALKHPKRERLATRRAASLAGGELSHQRVASLRPRGEFWTDDELLKIGSSGDQKFELWNGRIISMPPGGAQHGDVIMRLSSAIAVHVYEHKLGRVYDGQTGFRLGLENCFEPDIAFVSKARLKLILPVAEKLFHGAPDLAVEVLSPSDSITKTEKKLILCLAHGTRLAWMIDPKHQTARVYRPGGEAEILSRGRSLSGNSVLPGFRCALSRLFEEI